MQADNNTIHDIEELLMLNDSLIHEGHIITVLKIKNMLKLPTHLSQKFLQYYFEQRKDQLTPTYLIEGYKNNNKEYICSVVTEKELEQFDNSENQYTINIYSVQSNKSRANLATIWKQEFYETKKICERIDFKKELFIPEYSDIILENLKTTTRTYLFDAEKKQIDKDTEHQNKNAEDKNEINNLRKHIKQEPLSDHDSLIEENKNQLEKSPEKRKIEGTQTSHTIKSEPGIQTIVSNKDNKNSPSKGKVRVKTEITDTNISCNANSINKYVNITATTNHEVNKNISCETDLALQKQNMSEEESNNVYENIKNHHVNLFNSDSEESIQDKNHAEHNNNNNKNKRTLDDTYDEEPVKKFPKIKSVKQTQMFLENGYLVTVDNETCVREDESTSPTKDQEKSSNYNPLNKTIIKETSKKNKASHQTLLTSFFKKAK